MQFQANYTYRKIKNKLALLSLLTLSFLAVAPFFFVVFYLIQKGWHALSWDFFISNPKNPGELGGGMANAILGSGILVSLASLIGIPWGIALGIYLSEYKKSKTSRILTLVVDLLSSAPSIVIGIFIYGALVSYFGFSAYAGAFSLSIIMLPVVVKSTKEILQLIPVHIREAGLALGLSRTKMILRILLPGSLSMLVTGIMLAVARVAGETAPLLFTALGNQFFSYELSEPIASLPVQIYEFAKSGFEGLEHQAWTGALVLVFFVFMINLITRLSFYLHKKRSVL